MDGAGLIADFDLPQPRHPKEEVLVEDEALILWQAFVVVPYFPVHAVQEGPLGELQSERPGQKKKKCQTEIFFRHLRLKKHLFFLLHLTCVCNYHMTSLKALRFA